MEEFCTFTMCIGLIIVAVSAIAFHIMSKRRSEQHTLFTTLVHYALIMKLMFYGWMLKRRLEKESKNCRRVQERTLMKILRMNADTVYGREYKLGEMNNKYEFVANHPLTFYEHYKEYIDRVADGEMKVITSEPPLEVASSSGTTGDRKILIIEREHYNVIWENFALTNYCLQVAYPQARSLQKGTFFSTPFSPKISKTKGGLAITGGTAWQKKSRIYTVTYTTPLVALDIPTELEVLYVYLIFALKDRELGRLLSTYSMHLYNTFITMETHWKSLVNDIRRGALNEDLSIPELIRRDLDKQLSPDPERAEELRLEFEKGFDNTIVRRIWPHINFAVAVTSGTSALYAKKLREKYLDIQIVSTIYSATEGMIGINIWPKEQEPNYLLVPRELFFEFIPIENTDEDQPKTLFAEEVEVGSVYELVITNRGGLYRYRIGDVVKITGFYNNTPVLHYLYRKGQLLDLHVEKTSERVMYRAVQETLNSYPSAEMVDYTCTESIMLEGLYVEKDVKKGDETLAQTTAPYYVIFIEFTSNSDVIGKGVTHFAERLDQSICSHNPLYESFRRQGGIQLIKVFVLKPGTFDKLIQFYHNRNPLVGSRFKLPRLTKAKGGLELLLSNVI